MPSKIERQRQGYQNPIWQDIHTLKNIKQRLLQFKEPNRVLGDLF